MKAYRCLNCGFVFRNPKVVYRQRALNPGRVWAIAREGFSGGEHL